MDFSFYDLVWYWDKPKPTNDKDAKRLGRWLGVAHCVGSLLCYWILTEAGKVIAQTTVQHVNTANLCNPATQTKVQDFTITVNQRLSDNQHINSESTDPTVRVLDQEEHWSNHTQFAMPDGDVPSQEEYNP